MKRLTLFIGISALLILFSCKKKVTACIDAPASSYSIGQESVFTSCAENALSYDWRVNGPDGAPENSMGWSDRIIKVNFSVPGSYTITLNAYSDFSLLGDKESITANFTVN